MSEVGAHSAASWQTDGGVLATTQVHPHSVLYVYIPYLKRILVEFQVQTHTASLYSGAGGYSGVVGNTQMLPRYYSGTTHVTLRYYPGTTLVQSRCNYSVAGT